MTQALLYKIPAPAHPGRPSDHPFLTVNVKGKSIKTGEIKFRVTEVRSPARVTATFSWKPMFPRTECYEGESLRYKVSIFAAVRVADANFKKPDFTGFTVHDLPGPQNYNTNRGGRQYSVTEVSYLLTPIKPGWKTIDRLSATGYPAPGRPPVGFSPDREASVHG